LSSSPSSKSSKENIEKHSGLHDILPEEEGIDATIATAHHYKDAL